MVASFPVCKSLRAKNAKRSNFERRDIKQKDQIRDFSSTDQ
jgi:hypothetical protein